MRDTRSLTAGSENGRCWSTFLISVYTLSIRSSNGMLALLGSDSVRRFFLDVFTCRCMVTKRLSMSFENRSTARLSISNASVSSSDPFRANSRCPVSRHRHQSSNSNLSASLP